MFRSIPKRKALVVGLVVTLALAAGAYAYWTTTGAGSGSGSVASSNGTLVLHGTITSQLTPGGSSSVTFTADNSNSSSLQVGTVHAVVSIDEDHATAGCRASDFTSPTRSRTRRSPPNAERRRAGEQRLDQHG